jgi:thioredoxin-dependent peroxiredoxin
MLHSGESAPDFVLADADLEETALHDFTGRNHVVLYFYTKDHLPGCTTEAIEFSDREEAFKRCGCVILGISADDCFTHADFRDKHGISVKLLSDPDHCVSAKYDCWRHLAEDGRERDCLVRSTFVIDREGRVRHALYGVQPKGHADQVLQLVRQLH